MVKIKRKSIIAVIFLAVAVMAAGFWYFFSAKDEINYSISRNYIGGEYEYENRNKEFSVGFGDKEDSSRPWVSFVSGEDEVRMGMAGVQSASAPTFAKATAGEKATADEEVQGNNVKFKVAGEKKDKLLVKDILPQTDLSYEIIEKGVKEELTLKSREAIAGWEEKQEEPSYIFDLKLKNVEPEKTVEGNYSGKFVNKNNQKYAFSLLRPFMEDAKGEKSYDVTLQIKDNALALRPSLSWLADPERVYPVKIDPSIVHDEEAEFDAGSNNRTESISGPKVQLDNPAGGNDQYTKLLLHMDGADEGTSFFGFFDERGQSKNGNQVRWGEYGSGPIQVWRIERAV